jgi:hypothetical protein
MNEEEKKAVERMKQVLAKNVHTFINELEIVLNLIEKLQKENEELNKYTIHLTDEQYKTVIDLAQNDINQQWIQKVKDKIEEVQKEYNKLDKQVDEYINDANKDLSKYYENKEKIGTMQTLAWVIDNLQELLEGRK